MPDRILQGIDSYKENYSKKIIIVEEHKTGKNPSTRIYSDYYRQSLQQ